MIHLFEPSAPAHWQEARCLVEAYAASLDLDLSFQNFDDEIERLPTEYGPPRGAFLLAEASGRAIGCVGLRAFDPTTGEIKRLYVDPAARGLGAGRALAEGIVARAREIGYARLVLDTLPSMSEARALYVRLGFAPIAPYRFNPVPGTSFLELRLR
jgi:GNAT superfamily N-acetyltransferase